MMHWFVDNPIAANLLMVLIIMGGWFYYPILGKEVFPQSDLDSLLVSATYPGASPAEVERQIVVRIEEAIADLEGIDEINSSARESSATITIDVAKDFDTQRLLNNVKGRIDSLSTLPDEVDDIQVRESVVNISLMNIALYGNVAESVLKESAQWLQQELLKLEAIAGVTIEGTRERELSIEIPEQTLRRYHLSFAEVAAAIRQRSINLPAGTIKSQAGNFMLQTRGQAYSATDFSQIIIATGAAGAELTLGDIAVILDGFAEVDQRGNFNGYPAVDLRLFTSTPPDVIKAANSVKQTLEQLQPQLPPGVAVDIWRDWSDVFNGRMNLLLNNTLSGLVLVFVVLLLFLRFSLAIWVTVGIAITFLGVFWVLPFTDITLNMLSMYGFLLALGIVVDDAIIVGESVYAARRRGLTGRAAAKEGVAAVSKPVIFSVVSTIIFFAAIYSVQEGQAAVFSVSIATVVIICLLFSLIESLLILPSHLSYSQPEIAPEKPGRLFRLRHYLSDGMETLANNSYRNLLAQSLKSNGLTLTLFLVGLAIVLSLYLISGYLKKAFWPIIPSNSISITALLPEGAAFSEVKRIQDQIENAARQLPTDKSMLAINGSDHFIYAIKSEANNNQARVWVKLIDTEQRKITITQVKDRWRELIGPLPGIKELSLRFTIFRNRKALRFRVSLPEHNSDQLSAAVAEVRAALSRYQPVYQIEDTLEGPRTEYELRLKPYAGALGLTLADIARQLRQGFYGEEIQRIPRGSDDIKVMLRYPLSERGSIATVHQMYIRTNDGRSVPLNEVAEVIKVPGFTEIRRENRRRTIAITAEVTKGVDSLALANEFVADNLASWQRKYRGLTVEIAGAVADEKKFNTIIIKNFTIAFLLSFGLMAIIFRSYWQPVLVLTAIPFGFVGAILGHLLMGQTLTLYSMLGFIACAGVVVNDNLVLLDRIHRLRDQGMALRESVIQAGTDRFRAIMLTSLTTFFGLLPILSETSIQARFLIPMVISLAFGILFATVVTLIFVPNLYYFGENCRRVIDRRMGRGRPGISSIL